MEFQGLSKKQNAEFTGVGDQEKIMWNLQGLGYWYWNFQGM